VNTMNCLSSAWMLPIGAKTNTDTLSSLLSITLLLAVAVPTKAIGIVSSVSHRSPGTHKAHSATTTASWASTRCEIQREKASVTST